METQDRIMLGKGVAAAGDVGMIFISYRHQDSSGYANALQAKLEDHFGDAAIVRDRTDIRAGIDFRRFIPETIAKCSVLLALIGPRWLSAIDEDGRPRLEQEGDLVRTEIAQALQQERMLVIPVLVGGARMPPESSVPLEISALCRRSAVELSDDARWDRDVDGLIDAVQDALRERGLDVSDAYLRTLQGRFEEQGLECRTNVPYGKHRFGLVAKGPCWNLARQGGNPLLRIGFGSQTFFSISVHRDLAPDRLRDLFSDSFNLFTREHGRFKPCMNENGNFCFPVAALIRPSTGIDAFVREVKPRARGYLFTIPVIVDLRDRKVHVFEGTSLWGVAAYPFARQVAESALGTWPT